MMVAVVFSGVSRTRRKFSAKAGVEAKSIPLGLSRMRPIVPNTGSISNNTRSFSSRIDVLAAATIEPAKPVANRVKIARQRPRDRE